MKHTAMESYLWNSYLNLIEVYQSNRSDHNVVRDLRVEQWVNRAMLHNLLETEKNNRN